MHLHTLVGGWFQRWSTEDIKEEEEHAESGSHGVELWWEHVENVSFSVQSTQLSHNTWRPSPPPPLNKDSTHKTGEVSAPVIKKMWSHSIAMCMR